MKICFLLPLLLISFCSKAQYGNSRFFFNSSFPGELPELFAPGIVSDEFGNRDMAISPSGDEIFYTLQYLGGRSFSTIMYSRKTNGKWSEPEVAPFCGRYNDLEPAFSPDGKKLFFVSNRPLCDTSTKAKDFDIWFAEKLNDSWNRPVNPGEPVNTSKDEFYPSVTKNGNIYFTRNMGDTDEDIVVCRFRNNKYDTAISLPSGINSRGAEFNAFVDPDERFVIFTGYKRKDNYGTGDLFISYKNQQGEWTIAKNMGEKINGPGLTYCPYMSPDKKFFFFSTSRNSFKPPFSKSQSTNELKRLMHSPLNGWDNIYWQDAGKILNLK